MSTVTIVNPDTFTHHIRVACLSAILLPFSSESTGHIVTGRAGLCIPIRSSRGLGSRERRGGAQRWEFHVSPLFQHPHPEVKLRLSTEEAMASSGGQGIPSYSHTQRQRLDSGRGIHLQAARDLPSP
ncbi:unnamed protein product [Boreogadus saida]